MAEVVDGFVNHPLAASPFPLFDDTAVQENLMDFTLFDNTKLPENPTDSPLFSDVAWSKTQRIYSPLLTIPHVN